MVLGSGMMKFSLLLGGFFLLSLLFWNSSGLEPAVTSMCSGDWLITRIKRRAFDNDTEIKIGDIHLGNNCSVTKVLTFDYEFSCPVIFCCNSKLVFQGNDVFILSKISYKPTSNTLHKFQVVCLVKRLKFSSLPFGVNGNDASPLSDSSQVVNEGQQPSASSQSIKCKPNFSYNKDKLPMNYWIKNAYIKTSLP